MTASFINFQKKYIRDRNLGAASDIVVYGGISNDSCHKIFVLLDQNKVILLENVVFRTLDKRPSYMVYLNLRTIYAKT